MIRWAVIVLLLLLSLPSRAEEFAIVTLNPNLESLRLSQVKMLYRGRTSSVNGINVRLLDLPNQSPSRVSFYHQLLRKSPSQMSAIWARQSFSGKAIAPAVITSESKHNVFAWLQKNTNGIAYIPTQLLSEEVHVLYLLKE
ncbi:hypothetical protein F0231_03685 [Vibrio sp. RE86]|uniref:hypothetical protein n=1 Tax=Vibrio sp. RE86 TaxID=2607605 RepID=UPI0014933A58|nr:hypothetical protein [Vibrio sp. RE86]NOH78840.1 hypothetical protein [Vibrio sp. RE86]